MNVGSSNVEGNDLHESRLANDAEKNMEVSRSEGREADQATEAIQTTVSVQPITEGFSSKVIG
jgi:hypothetical protein